MNPYKRIVTLDFETYYSATYSLRSAHLNTSSYIRNPEFKAHCIGVKVDDSKTSWFRHEDIPTVLQMIDWKTSAVLAHHTQFDGLILSHHYGIVPQYYLDTLSMARALHSNAIGAGLDEVAGFYRIGHKTPDILNKLKGVREPDEKLLTELGTYCAKDVGLCWGIYQKMIGQFTRDELDLISMTVRMFADPVLELDQPRLKAELLREQEEKTRIIAASGVGVTILSSAEKFAHELTCSGVDSPPTKISKTTRKSTWAFSKTDLAFLDLRGHESERVRRLVEARLAAKSTIGESRAKRLIDAGRGGLRLPVYLKYYGAHTGRWAGGDKLNLQNLKRPEYDAAGQYVFPSAELRRSIMAPPGHAIVVADSAQIEARVLAWLAEDVEQLALFAGGADVYKHMAAKIYKCEIDDVTKEQRFVGKVATLGLGYGMGPDKFKLTLALGNMGPPMFLTHEKAQEIVNTYRATREKVQALWMRMERMLNHMQRKDENRPPSRYSFKELPEEKEGVYKCLRWTDEKKLYLPNDMYLDYPGLELDQTSRQYMYYDYKTIIRRKMQGVLTPEERLKEKESAKTIFGGAFTENVVQALARIVIGEQMLAIDHYLNETNDGFYRRIVTMTHDEIVVCAPLSEADTVLNFMLYVMRTPPKWASDLPLNAEGGYSEEYAK